MTTQFQNDAVKSHHDFSPNLDEWRQYAGRGVGELREIVRDNAGRSIFIALGAGLGAGLLVGMALGKRRQSSFWGDSAAAEGIGRRLRNKIEGLVPDAVSERLHD